MTQDTPSPEPREPDHPSGPADEAPPDPARRARTAQTGTAPPDPRPSSPVEQTPQPAPKPPPSWMLRATGEPVTREEMLARYRRMRGLPDDPFENGRRPLPPPGYRDRIMTEPRTAHFVERRPQPSLEPPARQARTFTIGQTFAIAAAMALVTGVGAGMMSAHFNGAAVHQPAERNAAAPEQPARQLQLAGAPVPRDTVIDKKPIATATLQVADVTGETNSFIPLALHAEPGGPDKDMLLKISGVPEGAYLTSGHRQGNQVWALSLAETKNVKLVVPRANEPQIDLSVAAFEPLTGELAAPVKTMTVALKDVTVEPTSAPPTGQTTGARPGSSAALPAAIPPPDSVTLALRTQATAETRQMIARADQAFRTGDVEQALRSYERAWGKGGSAEAAFGIARSYDPLVLASLARSNGTPDRARALEWYQRAASAGQPDAAEAIIRLQLKP